MVARSIENSKDRADALANLEPHLAELSQAAIYMLWGETLNVLSSRSRVNLLADLAALSHLITCLGGFSAARETAQAIVDIGRWWP